MILPAGGSEIAPYALSRWPEQYRDLTHSAGSEPPLAQVGFPRVAASASDPDDLADPTGDRRFRPLPHLVRKHRDRVVILVTWKCFRYCAFCFRGAEARQAPGEPGLEAWRAAVDWITRHPEIEEVILSGGDPLTLSDGRIARMGQDLAAIDHVQRWRIHTRAPVVLPPRVSPGLTKALRNHLPLTVVVHANHPAEVRQGFVAAVKRLRAEGIPVRSQSVLLTGVNDRAGVLADLFRRLTAAGVEPYYLHHPDRAPGSASFRLSLEQGLHMYRKLLPSDSAGARCETTPRYVVDLPNGAGKCAVADLIPVSEERGTKGKRVRYRWARPSDWDAIAPDRVFEWWDVWQRESRCARDLVKPATAT